MTKFRFTLLLHVSLVLALVALPSVSASDSHRRDHADLGRLLKKRAPFNILGDQPSVQGLQISTLPGVQSTEAASSPAQTTPTNSASVGTTSGAESASTPPNPSTTSGGGLLATVTSGLLSTESSTPSSAVTSSGSSASSHSPNTPQTSVQASKPLIGTPTQSVLYLTTSGAPTATQTDSTSSSSGMPHAAMTVLIVIGASVGAAIIVWTIIRKWKFRPSSDFEGRMQPIDWQPGGNSEDPNFPGNHRPLSRTSSFHSGSNHGFADDQTREHGGYDTSTLNPIPDHDFTAGPSHLAPVGGYADLARGASPHPMMEEPLGQAPSINRPIQYDQYGVPLHHGYSGY